MTNGPALVHRRDLWLGAAVVVLDQVAKALVRRSIPLHETLPVIPGVLNLTHVQNTGAAFGVLNAADFPFKSVVIVVVAVVALVAIAVYAGRFASDTALSRYGLGLILGGAVGNLIDRTVSGFVVDFVDVYWGRYHFWAFNVADSAITIGAALLILDMLRPQRDVSATV